MNALLTKPWARIALVALVAGGAWWAFQKVYLGPRRLIEADIRTAQDAITRLKTQLSEERELTRRRAAVGAGLLGSELDIVSARFRDGLTRVGSTAGLDKVIVEHGQPVEVMSPVLDAKGVSVELKRALRRQPDFQVLRGSIRGTGTLEQAVAAIGMLQDQPWVHRIDAFSLRPIGKERDRFDLRVDVATIYAPALASKADQGAPQLTPASAEHESTWRAIASRNLFRAPTGGPGEAGPSVVIAAAPAEGQATPAPAPRAFAPYEDWRLAGVASGRGGLSALFVNLRTGDRLTVLRGGQVLDAVLVDGAGELAVVEIAGEKFDVSVGSTLAARKPKG
ncbi:MAG: hypothetical protein DYG92_01610 [Leptolyngbya sp. PLA1]|nr:hypothetical protein [Leptolyngbya sp. PLA1]